MPIINPATISLALAAPSFIKSIAGLFGGGGGGQNIEDLIKQSRQNIIQTGGASRKLNEAILGQNLAGTSRLQKQAVLGQQQSRDTEALFNTLSGFDIQTLQLLLGEQGRKERLKAIQSQNQLQSFAALGKALPGLLSGKPQQQTTSTKQNQGVDIEMLFKLFQLFQNQGSSQFGDFNPNPKTGGFA